MTRPFDVFQKPTFCQGSAAPGFVLSYNTTLNPREMTELKAQMCLINDQLS